MYREFTEEELTDTTPLTVTRGAWNRMIAGAWRDGYAKGQKSVFVLQRGEHAKRIELGLRLARAGNSFDAMTTAQIVMALGGKVTDKEIRRIGKALRAAGYEQRKARQEGRLVRVWFNHDRPAM